MNKDGLYKLPSQYKELQDKKDKNISNKEMTKLSCDEVKKSFLLNKGTSDHIFPMEKSLIIIFRRF